MSDKYRGRNLAVTSLKSTSKERPLVLHDCSSFYMIDIPLDTLFTVRFFFTKILSAMSYVMPLRPTVIILQGFLKSMEVRNIISIHLVIDLG